MKFSAVTLATILLSTAIAAPMAEAQPNAIALADSNLFLSWFGSNGFSNVLANIAGCTIGSNSQAFNCNSFGDRLVALGNRCQQGSYDQSCFANAKQQLLTLCGTVPNYGTPQCNSYLDIGNHLITIGQKYQCNLVKNLNWGTIGDCASLIEVIAPPPISHSSISSCGDQLISWGNYCKSNPGISEANLQIIMQGCSQLQIFTQGCAPSWNANKKYCALDFGNMLISYGNSCKSGSVPASSLPSINGCFQNLSPCF
ncbi:hypothetical protein BABINDRAFT_163650 [Babjeviella inositovora NRRL Y-12698]|uniref:Uncharacterized protein n=1 Tax=Babjeviella inositovora NRRL Y-12698 TaxID=984486 RepID=A0A1E3QIX5_9ASCO|nr:uncharacterized protein BABINDRAFT_163650 [Babjeviella inositovora NRRL Y-12698]ODQ77404.1 hypothetical protein BABINDRAFT_163650 [Babjeviella inositovora NRRL Y-12698]